MWPSRNLFSPRLRSGSNACRGRRAATTLQERFDLICSEIPRAEWSDAVSHAYGRIKAALERRGTRIEDFDAAIAAHALAADATLVTANLGHMTRVPGLRIEAWDR
jgi:tRNA(fMet)-specific endonuclease VapC